MQPLFTWSLALILGASVPLMTAVFTGLVSVGGFFKLHNHKAFKWLLGGTYALSVVAINHHMGLLWLGAIAWLIEIAMLWFGVGLFIRFVATTGYIPAIASGQWRKDELARRSEQLHNLYRANQEGLETPLMVEEEVSVPMHPLLGLVFVARLGLSEKQLYHGFAK